MSKHRQRVARTARQGRTPRPAEHRDRYADVRAEQELERAIDRLLIKYGSRP